jgi:hypothetical protein
MEPGGLLLIHKSLPLVPVLGQMNPIYTYPVFRRFILPSYAKVLLDTNNASDVKVQ